MPTRRFGSYDYPVPAHDNGWGMHDSPDCMKFPSDVDAFADALRNEYGITWFKALDCGGSRLKLARALAKQGIEVVVRLYSHRPCPNFTAPRDLVRQYRDAGAHYFEYTNEPNLRIEWEDAEWAKPASEKIHLLAEQACRNFEIIKSEGGVPLFPPYAPGGELTPAAFALYPHVKTSAYPDLQVWLGHRVAMRALFDYMRDADMLSKLEGCAVAIHNRPLNHPLDYMDDSGAHFLDYQWIDDLVREYLGHSLPLLGTEAGTEPGWNQDTRYPMITPELHRDFNLEILRSFGPYGKYRWRDSLFCQCMWYWDAMGTSQFPDAPWHNNSKWAGGANLPAVAALKQEWAQRPFERGDEEPPKGLEEMVRNAAFNAGGIPYNPDAAFPKYARAWGLGNPETPEFDFTYQGKNYRGQGFSEVIVYAEMGQWDQINEVAW